MYEYIGVINLEIYHVETKGLDETQDGFAKEPVHVSLPPVK